MKLNYKRTILVGFAFFLISAPMLVENWAFEKIILLALILQSSRSANL